MTDPTDLTLSALMAAYSTGAIGPVEATAAYLARIESRNPAINAYIAVYAEEARAAAKASSARWREGRALSRIDGAPIALKDNIDLAGKPTANGCAFGSTPANDAEVVRNLRAAGAVILGKLNQHELALGATTDNPHWGQTQNPLKNGYTPGGSSGGSGAAVADRMAAATLGTDTMGSVRIPAAYCGVWGLKPTFGLVSNKGVSPLAWTLDHVGPLARAPEDLGLMLEAMAGGAAVRQDRRRAALSDLMIGRMDAKTLATAGVDTDVANAYDQWVQTLAGAGSGAVVTEIDWSTYDFTQARRAGLLVCEAQSAAAYAADLQGRPDRFSDSVRAMLDYGAAAAAPRLAAAELRLEHARSFVARMFQEVDLIALPTTPMTPFPFEGPHPSNQADLAAPANFTGCPAIALPIGGTRSGLPIGGQLLAPNGADSWLIRLVRQAKAAAS